MSIDLKTKKISIKEIVHIFLRQYGPIEEIIMFGSQVRGDADEYSDLDLIIVKNTAQPFVQRLADVPLLPVHSDVFVYTPEEFKRMRENENPFIMKALENAKVIYSKNEKF